MPDSPEVSNEVAASSIGAVVQAGTVHGGVHVHPKPDPVVPRQLPAQSDLFAGRAAELTDLDLLLGHGRTMLISAIGGAGGIGKTWLVLQWAHRRLSWFPDGQLFVDLRGFSPDSSPLAPEAAVRGFLDALGVDPSRLPQDLAAQAALYRSLVAERQMLIVLDNAATSEQVIPLLPGGDSCTVAVTSRKTLTGLISRHSAHHLLLDVLNPAEAYALLDRRLGAARLAAEPDAVGELVGRCGGVPLALGLIAGRALAHPRTSLAELAAELRVLGIDALEDDLTRLSAVVSWSYRALTDQQQVMFGLLGIAPGPDISLDAAASLAGLSSTETRRLLRSLEEASLLSVDSRGRWSMHDLIRQCAANVEISADVQEAALRRVIDFYVHTAYDGDHVLGPNRSEQRLDPPAPGCAPLALPDMQAALAWFDAEHACLLAAQRTAADLGWHRTTWLLGWSVSIFHARRGHLRDNLTVWQAALTAAQHLGDEAVEVIARRFVGSACADLGRHDEAIDHLQRCLDLTGSRQDATAGLTHRTLAWAWRMHGDHQRAAAHSAHAVELFHAAGHDLWEAWALNDLGWNVAQSGELTQARVHCRAALELFARHHDPDGEVATWDSLGFIEHHCGNHEDAIHHYRQALSMSRDLGATSQIADILEGLGHPHAALGRHEQARVVWREALARYQDQGDAEAVARVRRQLDAV